MTTVANLLQAVHLPQDPLKAQLYSALHRGNLGDVEFYRRVCAGAEGVLEFGSGAGRIALALAGDGLRVTGLELDSGLLDLARQRAERRPLSRGSVSFQSGDMTAFVARERFDRVIVPYSAFWCLRGSEAKRRCLRNAWECLREGGQLVLDLYDADIWAPEDGERTSDGVATFDRFEEIEPITVEGDCHRVWERNRWDAVTREMRVQYRVCRDLRGETTRALSDGRIRAWHLEVNHSVVWRHELAALLDECGFEVEWGADEQDEGTEFAEQLVVRATKC